MSAKINGEPLLKMIGISKSFGHVQSLKNIDFHVAYGEVVGLVGDNGAGKSTLIKILMGVHRPDSGEIYFEGNKKNFASPLEARAAGIEAVYQDLALVNAMSISRNFFLGKELTRKWGPIQVLIKKQMEQVTIEYLKDLGITVRSPGEAVSYLSGGERQAIAIARSIYFGAKLLILDEPTAALSVRETRKVLELVAKLRQKGVSVIFISHNLYHVYSVADKFCILDKGVKIGDFTKSEVTQSDLAGLISKGLQMAPEEES